MEKDNLSRCVGILIISHLAVLLMIIGIFCSFRCLHDSKGTDITEGASQAGQMPGLGPETEGQGKRQDRSDQEGGQMLSPGMGPNHVHDPEKILAMIGEKIEAAKARIEAIGKRIGPSDEDGSLSEMICAHMDIAISLHNEANTKHEALAAGVKAGTIEDSMVMAIALGIKEQCDKVEALCGAVENILDNPEDFQQMIRNQQTAIGYKTP